MDLHNINGKSIAIYYHIRPDGDCVGAAYGLAYFLQDQGNKTLVLGHDPVPQHFKYAIKGYTDDFKEDSIPADVIRIVVDTASPDRIGRFCDESIDLLIDHHMNNSINASIKMVDELAGSCTEVLWTLLKDYIDDKPHKKQICDLFYMGIITDTNSFRNEAVRPDTLKAAYELAANGADYFGMAQRHALIKTKEQIQFEERLTKSYRFYDHGIVCGILTQKDAAEIGVPINTYEILSNQPMIMADTRISLVVRELEDGTSRVAIRTRGDISAEELARMFGGGGHHNASGVTLALRPDEMADLFVKASLEYIEKFFLAIP